MIKYVGGVPIEKAYSEKRKYISGSNERMRRNRLFRRAIFFPDKLRLGLDDGRNVLVEQKSIKFSSKQMEVKYNIIDSKIGYISINNFGRLKGIETEYTAIKAVKSLWNSKALIIDVRGNSGGSTPRRLMGILMDRKYKGEIFAVAKQRSFDDVMSMIYYRKKLKAHEYAYEKVIMYKPAKRHYTGRIFILADHDTISAAEDFMMPFKIGGRATIIGSTTSGSTGNPHILHFDSGRIGVRIGALRCWMPDGSAFEGVGIKPDIAIYPSPENMRNGRDPVLEKALELAGE